MLYQLSYISPTTFTPPYATHLLRVLRLIVPRTTTGKRDAKSKPTQQHKHQYPNSAGVYRLPGQYRQDRQSGERHEFALPAFKPHAGPSKPYLK